MILTAFGSLIVIFAKLAENVQIKYRRFWLKFYWTYISLTEIQCNFDLLNVYETSTDQATSTLAGRVMP